MDIRNEKGDKMCEIVNEYDIYNAYVHIKTRKTLNVVSRLEYFLDEIPDSTLLTYYGRRFSSSEKIS